MTTTTNVNCLRSENIATTRSYRVLVLILWRSVEHCAYVSRSGFNSTCSVLVRGSATNTCSIVHTTLSPLDLWTDPLGVAFLLGSFQYSGKVGFTHPPDAEMGWVGNNSVGHLIIYLLQLDTPPDFFLSCHYTLFLHWKTHSFAVSLHSIISSIVHS